MNDEIKNLKQKLKSAKGKKRIEILCSLSFASWNTAPDDGIIYGNQALSLAKKRMDKNEMANAYNNIGINYWSKGDFAESLACHRKALKIQEENDDKQGIARSLGNMGIIYYRLGDYNEALQFGMRALEISEEMENPSGVVACLLNISGIYGELANYEKCLDFLERALEISQDLDNKLQVGIILHSIGLAHSQLDELEIALEYCEKSVKIKKELNDKSGMAQTYDVMGGIHRRLNHPQKAQEYFQNALVLSQAIADKNAVGRSLINLGRTHYKTGHTEQAIHFYHKAEDILIPLQAKPHLKTCYQLLSDAYESQGNIAKAFEYYKRYTKIKDEIFNTEKSRQITEIQTKYETEKKEKEAEIFRLKNIELAEANATKDKFFSIIAHDLRNPIQGFLNVAYLLDFNFDELTKKERKYYIRYLRNDAEYLADLLENLLEWSRTQTGKIEYKPEMIQINLLLENHISQIETSLREKNIEIHLDLQEPNMAYGDPNMFLTVIRNLISNAIKFTNDGGYIRIYSSKDDNFITISIEDSGLGISQERQDTLFTLDENCKSTPGTAGEQGTGLGLILCKEFVEKNGGKIWVESIVGEGSIFSFTIPLSPKNEATTQN